MFKRWGKQLWESYKGFCSKQGQAISRAARKFGMIRTCLEGAWAGLVWLVGSYFYLAAGAALTGLILLGYIAKALYDGLCYAVHKIFHVELPHSAAGKVATMDGVEFEQYVADRLAENGYHDICFTPASGDYGVDILAKKNGRRYAFQCKRYMTPVGVKAVQEVYSGCHKYGAEEAVVVTNSTYTPRARTLAHDLGVSLWDLETFDAIF